MNTSPLLRRAGVLGVVTAVLSSVAAPALAQPETEPAPAAPAEPAPAAPAEPVPAAPAPAATTLTPEAPPAAAEAAVQPAECPPAATEPAPERVEGNARVLKDHVFLFPAHVETSFVASYAGARVRVGNSSASNVPTSVGPLTITAVTLSEGLDAGVKITDWLGLFVTGGVRSLVSTNLEGLVLEGATYDVGGTGGLLVRLFRSDKTGSQLSLRGAAGYTRGQVATLYPLFDTPITSLDDLLQRKLGDEIRTPFSMFAYEGGLTFAQSFGRLFGLQASTGIGGASFTQDVYDRARQARTAATAKEFTFHVGMAPSVDFNAFRVPIAVMPEYVLARAASTAQVRGAGDFDTLHQLGLGVYYSGRTNLQLGLIWTTLIGARPLTTALGDSDSPKQHFGQLVLRYVW